MEEVALPPILRAPPIYFDILTHLRGALGWPDHKKALLIGIDGLDGSGKSSFASWLGWQLGFPTIHLDLYIAKHHPISWRLPDIQMASASRLDRARPRAVVIEGVHLLRVMEHIGRAVDYLIYVDETARTADAELMREERAELPFQAELSAYLDTYKPASKAMHTLSWTIPEL